MFTVEKLAKVTNLVMKLNNKCNELNKKYNAFDGACVLIASVISKNFEEEDIPYKIVVYSFDNECNDIHQVVENGNLCHVSVEVVIGGGRRFEIGGHISNDMIRENGIKKFYQKINSEQLYEIYNNCDWNNKFDRKYTQDVINQIEDVFFDNPIS